MAGSANIASRSDASAGPSIRTIAGRNSSSASTSRRAEPGPWWRMPKIRTSDTMGSGQVDERAVVVRIFRPLLEHGLEILLQHHLVLYRVLDDRADHVGRDTFSRQLAVVEERSLA